MVINAPYRIVNSCLFSYLEFTEFESNKRIRCHSWITAFFLKRFNRITEVTIDSKVFYLNRNSARQWCGKHAQPFDDKGAFIAKVCSAIKSQTPKCQPKFEMLSDFGIDNALIEKFKKEIKEGDYTAFSEFLKNLTEDLLNKLNQAQVLPLFVWMFEKGIENDEINVELARQVIGIFSKCKLMKDQIFKPNISLVSKEKTKISANKALCFACIPDYFKPAFAKFGEKESRQIEFPLLSERCLLILGNFIYHEDYIFLSQTTLDECVSLYSFSQSVVLKELSDMMICQMLNIAGRSVTEEQLQKFLTSINSFCASKENALDAEAEAKIVASSNILLDEELVLKLIAEAFSSYFKNKYKIDCTCGLTSNVLSVPVQALAEVKKDSIIGRYLRQFFTCITVGDLTEDARKNLNILLITDLTTVMPAFKGINVVVKKGSNTNLIVEDIKKLFTVFTEIEDGYLSDSKAMYILEKTSVKNKIYFATSYIFLWDTRDIWAKITSVVGITSQTDIYQHDYEAGQEQQCQKWLQEKVQRTIKAVRFYQTQNGSKRAQITFEDE